mmetsp:Transcript_54066/g.114826  ORF Transcript_54066/g.114826 Transcript_54066/m.114826 type:complete len:130 (+) Transcript_54066:40-429(+)
MKINSELTNQTYTLENQGIMKTTVEASREISMAIQRLALSKVKEVYSRVPKRKWIRRQQVEEAKIDLERAEAFSKIVEEAATLLKRVSRELDAEANPYHDSWPVEVQRPNKRRRVSRGMVMGDKQYYQC